MIQTVSRADFHEDFARMRPDNFTPAGRDALFDYLEQYEADSGEAVELDVIALCCEYSEYSSMQEYWENGNDEQTIDDLREITTVIEILDTTDGFIIADF